MTSDPSRRLLQVLALVPRGGRLDPEWEPRSRSGAVYGGAREGLDPDQVAEDLEWLADRDYLERIFVQRLMNCPACASHAVNVHEACVTCASSNLLPIISYFHFRCGYIGPEKTFSPEPGGLRCPKCKKLLVDLGTDHDSPGVFFECLNCSAMFQEPQMGVRCLSCGGLFHGPALEGLKQRDISAYRLTLRGEEALTRGVVDASERSETVL